MPEQLLAAVKELTQAVKTLEETLHQYPKREEVEDRFATKDESHARAMKFLLIGLAFVVFSFFSSIVVTVTTVSVCFISPDARAGGAPEVCGWVPGYAEAQAENRQRLEQFRDLLERPDRNKKRIERLEDELGISRN